MIALHKYRNLEGIFWRHGNPKYYSTYEDESENGIVASIGRASHMATFAFTVLQREIAAERHVRVS